MGDSSAPNDNLGESPTVELTGKIMVIIIIIMFFVVVIALGLHIFARGFWWRSATLQSRSRRRRLVFSSAQDGGLRGGLDPSVLRSIPVLVLEGQQLKDCLECAVCLSEVVEGEKVRLLPKCNHGFHVDCIDMWFQSHATCPLCRNPIDASMNSNDSQNSESESPTFPTNVLVWGDQTQISSTGAASTEEGVSQPPCSSSSSSSSSSTSTSALVIDIPREITSAEDDLKSPMTGRLRSLKRLLSRDSRLNPWSPTSVDVEQPGHS